MSAWLAHGCAPPLARSNDDAVVRASLWRGASVRVCPLGKHAVGMFGQGHGLTIYSTTAWFRGGGSGC